MRPFLLLYITLILFTGSTAIAQAVPDLKAPRILILLDESSSMIDKWGKDEKRFEVADKIILNLMDSIYQVNDQVEFSLRVFGHQYTVPENNCYDTKNEVMFSKNNYTQMSLRLASITPLGVTPIAYALQEAAENDLTDEWRYAYSIVLITDGGESCGGNICEVVKNLLSRKINFKPYIVSLVDYAPLRTEYDCLGNYLQVTASKDIPKTVSTIVQSYRPMLKPVATDTNMQVKKTTAIPQPVAVVPKPQPQIEAPKVETPKIDTPKPAIVKTEPPKADTPKHHITLEPPRVKETTSKITINRTLTQLSFVRPIATVKTVALPRIVMIAVVPEAPEAPVVVAPPPLPPRPAKTKLPRMALHKELKSLSILFDEPLPVVINTIPHTIFVAAQFEPAPAPVVIAPPPAPTPKPVVTTPPPTTKPVVAASAPAPKPIVVAKAPAKKPAVPAIKKDEGKEVPFTVETVDAKETSMELYFTDGKGKFYYTSPQVMVNDPKTGETIQKFYRTLDAASKPDDQKMKEGNYNIVIGGKSNMIVRNITVQPNKVNKIMVVVTSGTLKFVYNGAPNRPITEFNATVILRTDRGGPVINQKCNVELGYDPGNYFIEINTLPVSRRNEDIEPGAESILVIDQPGFVQFTNQNKLGNVSLYTPLGDMFAKFHTIEISGNVASQKLQLQPGTYQAHFFKDATKPYAQETITTFNVKSNATTEVELK